MNAEYRDVLVALAIGLCWVAVIAWIARAFTG